MIDNRAAILNGVKGAHELHRDLGIREQIERSEEWRIDVFGVISKLGATLMCQPLDKLLGAYIPGDENGVLITTQRSLPIQRFTAAHELGHLYMQHEPSLDDEGILRRSPFTGSVMVDRQEREADAFASTFLVPPWLIAILLQKQAWPYGYGDDPSFFCHHIYGAPLTWGVTNRDIRDQIEEGDVALFFSFSTLASGCIEYRFCAAARVQNNIRRTDIFRRPQYAPYRDHLNLLVHPVRNGWWAHREPGLLPEDWHEDWVSLFVSADGANESVCNEANAEDSVMLSPRADPRFLHCGGNYVIFSSNPIETQVMSHPPVVAFAMPSAPEHWVVSKPAQRLWRLTLGTAQESQASRVKLRTRNKNVPHPSLKWSMPPGRLDRWFEQLLHVMSLSDGPSSTRLRATSLVTNP